MSEIMRIRIKEEDMPESRSPLQMEANGRKAGRMRDKKDRRSKNAKYQDWMNEDD